MKMNRLFIVLFSIAINYSNLLAEDLTVSQWGPSREIFLDPSETNMISMHSYELLGKLQENEVVLTYDDGPYYNPYSNSNPNGTYYKQPTTEIVMSVLKEENVQAIFFLQGNRFKDYLVNVLSDEILRNKISNIRGVPYASEYEVMSTEEASSLIPSLTLDEKKALLPDYEGHTIANHSYSHNNMSTLTLEGAKADILKSQDTIEEYLGIKTPYFRFPFGASTGALRDFMGDSGMIGFDWDVDSKDTSGGVYNKYEEIEKTTLEQLSKHRKGIILFHDTRRVTAMNVKRMIKALKENGYKPAVIRFQE